MQNLKILILRREPEEYLTLLFGIGATNHRLNLSAAS